MILDNVTRKLEAAVINFWVVKSEVVHFELFWKETRTTFGYFMDTYMHDESESLRWYFSHDYDYAWDKCPLCGNYGEQECLELSEEQMELLKDKLIQKDLKLMYMLK
jgi:hypothetical protein